MPRRLLPLLCLAAAAAMIAAPRSAAAPGDPPVTVIGDSVLTSIAWYQANLDVLGQGFDVDLHAAVGRRLTGVSIPFDGVTAPTLVDLVPTLALRPTVVVEMGYNDDPADFRAEAEQAIDLLLADGAQRIVWATLAASRPEFASMNDALTSLLVAYPELTLADWNGYSAGHDDWFQTDHLHLMPAGGLGLATLLHGALATPLAGSGGAQALPEAFARRPFHARIAPPAGCPCAWRLVGGSLPHGVTLADDGSLAGAPAAVGSFRAEAVYETPGFLVGHLALTLTVGPMKRHASSAVEPRRLPAP